MSKGKNGTLSDDRCTETDSPPPVRPVPDIPRRGRPPKELQCEPLSHEEQLERKKVYMRRARRKDSNVYSDLGDLLVITEKRTKENILRAAGLRIVRSKLYPPESLAVIRSQNIELMAQIAELEALLTTERPDDVSI